MDRSTLWGVEKLATGLCLVVLVVFLASQQRSVVWASSHDSVHTATEAKAQAEPSIIYDPQTNTIEVRRSGSIVNLTAIYNALRNNSLLEPLGRGEWLLKVNLKTYEQVRLELHGQSAGGDVNWLKLKSEPSGYAMLTSSNGQISIRNTKITSWDTRIGNFDYAFEDGSGRAYISAKNRTSIYTDNRMDVINSEVAYLGFLGETAYGISWKVNSDLGEPNTGILGKGLTGNITGSKFHHNYFGVYVSGAGDMQVSNNEFYENFRYGFDAYAFTQRVTVENSISRDNGTHGIILANKCTENVIRKNTVTNNKGDGIVLFESSNNNVIEDNTVTGNDDGVLVFESSDNVIGRNFIRDNVIGVRVYGRTANSSKNLFEDNEISGSKTYGVFMYDAATENTFRHNRIISNHDAGFYMLSVFNNLLTDNIIRDNEYGIRFDSTKTQKLSRGNQVRSNTIENSRRFGVYSYAPQDGNWLENNQLAGNKLGDTGYPGGPVAGSTRGGIPQWLGLGLVAAIGVVGIITGLLIYLRRWTGNR